MKRLGAGVAARYRHAAGSAGCRRSGSAARSASSSGWSTTTHGKLEQLQLHFARFAPDDVVEQLTEKRGEVKAKRRVVTVLFADLKGFTALVRTPRLGGDGADPERLLPLHEPSDHRAPRPRDRAHRRRTPGAVRRAGAQSLAGAGRGARRAGDAGGVAALQRDAASARAAGAGAGHRHPSRRGRGRRDGQRRAQQVRRGGRHDQRRRARGTPDARSVGRSADHRGRAAGARRPLSDPRDASAAGEGQARADRHVSGRGRGDGPRPEHVARQHRRCSGLSPEQNRDRHHDRRHCAKRRAACRQGHPARAPTRGGALPTGNPSRPTATSSSRSARRTARPTW